MEKSVTGITDDNPPSYSEIHPQEPLSVQEPHDVQETPEVEEPQKQPLILDQLVVQQQPVIQDQPAVQAPPVLIVEHVVIPDLGKVPRRMNCPYCRAEIETKVNYREGYKTHLAALCSCVVGCCLFMPLGLLFWIPYCIDECKEANHECPSCNRPIGRSA